MINLSMKLLQENTSVCSIPTNVNECDFYKNALEYNIKMSNQISCLKINKVKQNYYGNDCTETFKNDILLELKDFISDQFSSFTALISSTGNTLPTNCFEYNDKYIDLSNDISLDINNIKDMNYKLTQFIYEFIDDDNLLCYPKKVMDVIFYNINKMINDYCGTIFGFSICDDLNSLLAIVTSLSMLYSTLLSIIIDQQIEKDTIKEAVYSPMLSLSSKKINIKILSFVDKFTDLDSELKYVNKSIIKLKDEVDKIEKSLSDYKSIPIADRDKEAAKLNTLLTAVKAVSYISQMIIGFRFIAIDNSSINTKQIIKDAESNIREAKRVLKFMNKRKRILEANIDRKKISDKIFNKGGNK